MGSGLVGLGQRGWRGRTGLAQARARRALCKGLAAMTLVDFGLTADSDLIGFGSGALWVGQIYGADTERRIEAKYITKSKQK